MPAGGAGKACHCSARPHHSLHRLHRLLGGGSHRSDERVGPSRLLTDLTDLTELTHETSEARPHVHTLQWSAVQSQGRTATEGNGRASEQSQVGCRTCETPNRKISLYIWCPSCCTYATRLTGNGECVTTPQVKLDKMSVIQGLIFCVSSLLYHYLTLLVFCCCSLMSLMAVLQTTALLMQFEPEISI